MAREATGTPSGTVGPVPPTLTGVPPWSIARLLRRPAALAVAVALGATACGGRADSSSASVVGSTPPGSSGPPAPSALGPSPTIRWERCGDVECGRLEVPLDHRDPAGATISLALVRRPADDARRRVGALLVNPGGPGVPGTYLAERAGDYFSSTLLERFDLVAWDPRGTGESAGVDCTDDLDALFGLDPTPDSVAERTALIDAARAFAADCERRVGDVLGHISTQDSARDMDAIRAALGEEQISYLGFSYGSELGSTYATLFPERVRAMVLDGAVDPNLPFERSLLVQARAFEEMLDAFLADCSARSRCAFSSGGDAEGAFDRLMASLDADPLPSPRGRPPVGQGVAYFGIIQALYDRAYWPTLGTALAAARDGDGSGLLRLYDSYLDRRDDGTWADTIEALLAISCVDNPGPTSVAEVEALVERTEAVAPRLGAWFATSYWCLDWPVPPAPPLAITAAGAGPVLVIGTTGDTATPYELTRSLAAALEDGVLLTWEGKRHGAYVASACVQRAVDAYLVDGKVPEPGTTCRD